MQSQFSQFEFDFSSDNAFILQSAHKKPDVKRLSLTPGLSFQFGKLCERFASLTLILQLSAVDSPFTAERLLLIDSFYL